MNITNIERLKIGLTGGIGSGKSTVARLFAELGVPVIDADTIARTVIARDTAVLEQIMQHFGTEVLDKTGRLNRDYLRQIVFEQPEQRLWLEALLHPLILTEIKHEASEIRFPYCLLVIPLLVEATQPYTLVDRILVVDTTEELQIKRAEQRDQLPVDVIRRIMASQATRSQRLQLADDIIKNEGNLQTLAAEVRQWHQRYLTLADKKNL